MKFAVMLTPAGQPFHQRRGSWMRPKLELGMLRMLSTQPSAYFALVVVSAADVCALLFIGTNTHQAVVCDLIIKPVGELVLCQCWP